MDTGKSSLRNRFAEISGLTPAELSVRRVAVLEAPRVETLMRQVYFEGGNVLVCTKGSYAFVFADGESVELHPGEMLVVYPGNYVTIRAVKAGGRLNYVILNGTAVSELFNSLGYYDHMLAKVDPQEDMLRTILKLADSGGSSSEVLSYVIDALRTFRQRIRETVGVVLNDAIVSMHECIARGEVGIQSICDEINVSRSYLDRLFKQQGMPAPGIFIRREQYRLACLLLRNTKQTIASIGRSVGISSPVYFSNFIRRMSNGCTPREIRLGVHKQLTENTKC